MAQMQQTRLNGRLVQYILTGFGVLVIGLSTWTLKTVHEMSLRLAVVEGNRFTSADGKQVWQELSQIREILASMPKEVPPGWFKAQVDTLEKRIDSIAERFGRMEQFMINSLEDVVDTNKREQQRE